MSKEDVLLRNVNHAYRHFFFFFTLSDVQRCVISSESKPSLSAVFPLSISPTTMDRSSSETLSSNSSSSAPSRHRRSAHSKRRTPRVNVFPYAPHSVPNVSSPSYLPVHFFSDEIPLAMGGSLKRRSSKIIGVPSPPSRPSISLNPILLLVRLQFPPSSPPRRMADKRGRPLGMVHKRGLRSNHIRYQ